MPKTKASKAKVNSTKSPRVQSDSVSLILPYLYVGPCSATSATSTFIARHGITHIISLGKKPNSTLDSLTYLRLSIEDDPSANLSKAGGEAIAFIDKARAGKTSSKIFVHCFAGISRSPAIVAFYLMQSCGMSLKRALGLVVSARPNACPNPGFVSQLQQAELECRGSSSFPLGLLSLPRKKEDRLALFREGPPDDANQESSRSAPILDTVSLCFCDPLTSSNEETYLCVLENPCRHLGVTRKIPMTSLTPVTNVKHHYFRCCCGLRVLGIVYILLTW
jgi:atypical dual specificity phosphatase